MNEISFRHLMPMPEKVYEPKLTVSALLAKRKFINERCKLLTERIDKINDEQNDELQSLKIGLQAINQVAQTVGTSLPDYFQGDLLDINTYIKYGDYFFYGKPITSTANFLKDEVKIRLLGAFGGNVWDSFSDEKRERERVRMTRIVADEKTKQLVTSRKMNEKLEKCLESINSIEGKIKNVESQHGIQSERKMTPKQQEQFMRLFK